jgi:hypothetical protein
MAERRNFYMGFILSGTEKEAIDMIVEDDGWDELPETMMQAAYKWPGEAIFKVTLSVERVK